MIKLKYRNRTCNRLFQYCFARVLADKLSYRMEVDKIPGFPSLQTIVEGQEFPTTFNVNDDVANELGMDGIVEHCKENKCGVAIKKSNFENYDYIKDYRDVIRDEWIIPDPSIELPPCEKEDLIVHIRRGDMVDYNWAMPFDYYERLLSIVKYDNLFVVSDFPNSPFVRRFARAFNPTILSEGASRKVKPNNVIQDLKTIMSFNKIGLSSGTFGWWGAYLSDAEEVYHPCSSEWNVSGTLSGDNLHVPESRWLYVNKKKVKLF